MLYSEALKDPKVFVRLYKKGKSLHGYGVSEGISAYYQMNRLPFNRYGITAGKKVGGAVQRNRAKRIIRAAYRKNELKIPIGYDIVFVARNAINGKKSTDLDAFFVRLSKDAGKNAK